MQQSLNDALKEHIIPRKPTYFAVGDTLEPDVWLAPSKVSRQAFMMCNT
jgi:hypothetical protein